MDLSLFISIGALGLSVFTYFVHDAKIKRQEKIINDYEIQKIQKEKSESQKALIKANSISSHSGETTITIFNAGKNRATNIRFEILSDSDNIFMDISGIFPYELLNPQESIDIHLHAFVGSPDKIKIQLSWDDDSGKDNKHEQILKI